MAAQPMTSWMQRLRAAPVWAGLVAILWISGSVAMAPADQALDLAGTWNAQVTQPPSPNQRTIRLPGLFAQQGIPSSATVVARQEVRLHDESVHAVWLDGPHYQVTARWDGVEVGSVGDTNGQSKRTLLAFIPPSDSEATHTLELQITGDYGRGGLTGRILFGPATEVVPLAQRHENQRTALALGLSLLAFLPLAVAATRPSRPAYLYFGLFAAALAALSWCQADISSHLLPDPLANIRARRLAEGPLAGLVISFATAFVYGKATQPASRWLAFGVATSVVSLLVSPGWMYGMEVLQDTTLLITVPWYLYTLVQGVRLRARGVWLLVVLTSIPVVWAVGGELLHSHGLRQGSSHLFQASVLVVSGLGAALVYHDAVASERHERLVNQSVDAMITVNLTGDIFDANPAALTLLGPCLGRNLLAFVDPEDRPLARAHLVRLVDGHEQAEFRLSNGRATESLTTRLDDGLYLLLLRDITQRRNVDKGLLRAARLETVGMLLGGIAHDFNNMLSTLLAHVGYMQAVSTDSTLGDRLQRMETTIDRASQLTRRLLTVARGSSAELGPVDLAPVCQEAIELVEPTLPSHTTLVSRIEADLPPIHGDAAELAQVLVNLLVNARDALEETGGQLLLEARRFQLEDGARGVCVLIEDTGTGIPEAMVQEIFQPFVTTKGRGTGLGLAVATQVMRDHHGRLWYERRQPRGSRFCMALRHADAVDEAPAPMPEGRTVLLVDDEPVLLETTRAALESAGYTVHAMNDPTAAAAWLMARKPDILVTDVVMEGLSGIEVATLCSHRFPDVPVLLVSAFIPEYFLTESSWHRLHKPVRVARLVATVGRLRRRAERSESGDQEITRVSYLFPSLDDLSADVLGFTGL